MITFYRSHDLSLVVTLLNVAAVPAITEELLFRVLIQRGLESASHRARPSSWAPASSPSCTCRRRRSCT